MLLGNRAAEIWAKNNARYQVVTKVLLSIIWGKTPEGCPDVLVRNKDKTFVRLIFHPSGIIVWSAQPSWTNRDLSCWISSLVKIYLATSMLI